MAGARGPGDGAAAHRRVVSHGGMAVSTSRFTPVDIATLLYVAVATGAVLAFTGEDHAGWDSLMVAQALLVVLVLLASRAREAGPVGRFLCDWYPMLLLGGLYAEVGVVNVGLRYPHHPAAHRRPAP